MQRCPNSAPAGRILAVSGENRQAIKRELQAVSAAVQKDAAEASELFRKSLARFSSRDNCRLLMAPEPASPIEDRLSDVLFYLDGGTGVNLRKKGIFFGQGRRRGKIGFVFPGQGSQYLHMGAGLVPLLPGAGALLREAARAAAGPDPLDAAMFPEPAADASRKREQEKRLRRTDLAQPAIGAVSLVMLELLRRFGVLPEAVCGHSYGELTALYAAGRLSRQDFFTLSAARGKYMAQAGREGDAGRMLAVKAPIEETADLIRTHGLDLILANRNSPEQGVVSGPSQEVEKMQAICRKNHIRAVLLPVSAAFHSRLVESAARPFCKRLDAVRFHPSSLPVYANTTGRPYPPGEASARRLLGRHLLHPVHFIDAVRAMFADGVETFVEVGPKAVLTGLIRSILSDSEHTAVAMDGSGGKQPALQDLARALCEIAAAGHFVDFTKWPAAEDEAISTELSSRQ
jgi:acyl transferase domain-containing protein